MWFVPAATFTVTVTLPSSSAVTFTLLPLTDTLTTSGSPDVAVIAPSPARVTVTEPVGESPFSDSEVGLRLREPAALAMLHATVLAAVVPSLHW